MSEQKIDLAKIAQDTVQRCHDVFRDAMPADFEIKYELCLKLGATAGLAHMVDSRRHKYLVKLNAHLLVRNPKEVSHVTLPHEIAHCVDHAVAGGWGHGRSWYAIMMSLGFPNPQRCHNMDIVGMKRRRGKREEYAAWCLNCGCHNGVSMTQKGRLERGLSIKKKCAYCSGELTHADPTMSCVRKPQ